MPLHEASCVCNRCSGGESAHAYAGGAFVIVFDSKQDGEKKIARKPRSKGVDAPKLEFINITGSSKYGPGARQLVRAHVMSDYWRKYMAKNGHSHRPRVDQQNLEYLLNHAEFSASLPPLCSQSLEGPDPFSILPIKMQPFMYPILRCKLYPSQPTSLINPEEFSPRCRCIGNYT